MNILDKSGKRYIIILFLIGFYYLISCDRKESYLKEAVMQDLVICPLIHTGDSEIILVEVLAQTLVKELKKCPNIENVEDYICKQIENNISIGVSEEFYKEVSFYRIHSDSIMDDVYNKYGVRGLIEKYFKKEDLFGGKLILWNEQERFVVKNQEPYPAFGQDTNTSYMIYLLSRNNIYLSYEFLDHILMITIEDNYSDMSTIKTNKSNQ